MMETDMQSKKQAAMRVAAVGIVALFAVTARMAAAQEDTQRLQSLEQQVEDLSRQVETLRAGRAGREVATFSDAEGTWGLRVFGRVHLDYRAYDPGEVLADTFSLRRARLGASLSFMKHYGMTVEGEYASGSASTGTQGVALTNGYLDLNWFPNARIRAGQFKPQFGLENTNSANFIDFQERALTQSLIQNLNYDRGVMVWGRPAKGFGYAVTLSNGSGANTEEAQSNAQEASNDGKDVTVRVYANFAERLEKSSAVLHLGASHKNGSAGSRGGTAFRPATLQTEARGVTFFTSETLGLGKVDRNITATEGIAAFGPVKLQAEWWQAEYEGDVPQAYRRRLEAGYVSALWMLTGEHYARAYRNGGWGRMHPNSAFSPGEGGGWGAWEIGVRYSLFDGSDFTTANPAGTGVPGASSSTVAPPVAVPTGKAEAITLGLKWIPSPHARVLLNYVETRFDTPVIANGVVMDDEKALLLRAQVDF
jgi:phosphate-selective porin OprO and OprP